MGSKWGEAHGEPGYDRFRTGLTFAEVRRWLWSHSDNAQDWGNVTRRTVLGKWHEHKRELWERARERGLVGQADNRKLTAKGKSRGIQGVTDESTRTPHPKRQAQGSRRKSDPGGRPARVGARRG